MFDNTCFGCRSGHFEVFQKPDAVLGLRLDLVGLGPCNIISIRPLVRMSDLTNRLD